eukprot:jgi/Bigna1/127899/aug1.5_g2607
MEKKENGQQKPPNQQPGLTIKTKGVLKPDAPQDDGSPKSPLPAHVRQACEAAKVAPISNPFPQILKRPVYTNGDRFLLCLVGLPGRGKTFISYRVKHWLTYFHDIPTQVVNLGNARRKLIGRQKSHQFFTKSNEEAKKILDKARKTCLDDIKKFLLEDEEGKHVGRVAIYDAANITVFENRQQVVKEMDGILPLAHIIFVEIIQTDPEKILNHIRSIKVHVGMPDYRDEHDKEKAVEDYLERVKHYQTEYVTMKDKSKSYIKIVDDGRQVSVNRIKGFLPGQIVNYLMNLHSQPRPLYLSRHGESQYNVLKKIGGNSPLSTRGEKYAVALSKWVKDNVLNPKTYEEVKRKAPQQFEMRCKNKLDYRYPAVLRIVYAYFMMMDKTKAPTISIPLNTVIKLVPKNHGCDEERFVLVNEENKDNSNNAPSH